MARFTGVGIAALVLTLLCLTQPQAAETDAGNPVEAGATDLAEVGYLPSYLSQQAGMGELFGGRTGYLHPFLSLGEYYTDNLFNESDNKEDDWITVISPGLWASFPASNRQPLQVTTYNSAPGGLEVTRFPMEVRRRFQGYGLYRADITEHAHFSEEDNVFQRAEGLLNVNFRGGLSLELLDIFQIDHDPYGTGAPENPRQLDKFTSNLVQFMANYRITPKTRVRADVSHYSLEFDNTERNGFRERDDLVASLFLFHRVLPKTSALLQYDYINIDYRENILSDSTEHRFLTGILWDITSKSRGTIKVGYGLRQVDQGDNRNDLIGEARLDHRFTPKTSAYLQFTRRVEETDIADTSAVLSHRLLLGYRQRVAPRWTAAADLNYTREAYQGEFTSNGETGERTDDNYGARVGLGYLFRSWLNFGLGYIYLDRNSNFDNFSYTNNTVYLTVTAAL